MSHRWDVSQLDARPALERWRVRLGTRHTDTNRGRGVARRQITLSAFVRSVHATICCSRIALGRETVILDNLAQSFEKLNPASQSDILLALRDNAVPNQPLEGCG